MATSPTVPMFSPDGTLGDIPYEKMHDATQAGFKMGVNMLSPEGRMGVIPADRTQDALQDGMKVVPYHLQDADGEKPGFWSTFGGDLKQAASAIMSTPREALQRNPSANSLDLDPRSAAAHKAITKGPAAAQNLFAEDTARKNAGYSLPYRVAAPLVDATGVANVSGSEESAAKGDTWGVLGHAVASAAPLAIGETARLVAPKINLFGNVDRAGKLFNEVATAARDTPVPVTDAMSQAAARAQELADSGAKGMPRVISKFVARVTDPERAPVTWREARDFYSNVSRLSANEYQSMNPQMAAQIGKFAGAFDDSLRDTAEQAGKGDEYSQAMQLYRTAKVWQKFGSNVWQGFKTALPYAGGTAAGAAAGKTLYDFLASK